MSFLQTLRYGTVARRVGHLVFFRALALRGAFGGGQKEILSGPLSDLLWKTKEECVAVTTELIKDKNRLKIVQEQAITRARFFSQEKFDQKVWRMTHAK